MGLVNENNILFGNVMHGRLFPKKNKFNYSIYYLSIPLSKRNNLPIAYNRFAPMSFYDRDHGACDGSDLNDWVKSILSDYNIDKADGEIVLICMPRIFGYVFNPVSFWLCHDKSGAIRAIICEVHNTFGERHSYLCAHPNQRPVSKSDIFEGNKVFHVSPFLEREGHYDFTFDLTDENARIVINYYDAQGDKKLITSLFGEFKLMSSKNTSKAFWAYPLITVKAITLIYWQALKIIAKGIRYISRPEQMKKRISAVWALDQNKK